MCLDRIKMRAGWPATGHCAHSRDREPLLNLPMDTNWVMYYSHKGRVLTSKFIQKGLADHCDLDFWHQLSTA